MNFELNEDTKSILETTRRFVKREVLPRIKEEGFKRDTVTKMGEMRLFGCAFPPTAMQDPMWVFWPIRLSVRRSHGGTRDFALSLISKP